MRVEWDEEALRDRERIFDFLYPFNPQAAEQADAEIDKAVKRLLDYPELGKIWYRQARKLLVSQASLLVLYVVVDDVIKVLAVAHQREKFPDIEN
ncbi:type II toxin-antitoxin system RelE/ParE family toxin [Serratia liquefaciens]|jgi:toxin ParE1/3/4|uniref:type II toxin-antitoxin system RelE/ParE family toxin n=1 Tax=Serratia liquefaciens TaxID=614 RepID=UPI0003584BE3|nr:type II toxin-antitoxin system mRNA interferase toxin, RelE/StbE family [Serratia liquefaciens]AGQ29244.1 translation repressor RelE [Serratia liquefaciens ATCC 27592]MBF8106333.1 type II toxin-antitoxin system mRNA interferase toxin, RelE/StbE family [Serratia liquefaciens]MBH2812412.1 type II toxin-antitoxin system mRNA interferase toxin, RelE/StbE family [Serratia liquefaciens]MCH4198092.1 type II toxin-antitoxin system mRNA interferase toxin, RelE/StbE family [Serratia liquefaciens]MCH4